MKRSKKKRNTLAGRIADWENMMGGKGSDIVRKHPRGFKKPGSNTK